MKKTIAAGMALLLLAALSFASASEAGTVTDPLITRSYIDGTYADSVIKAGTEVIEARLEAFRQLLNSDPLRGLSLTQTDGWEPWASQVGCSATLVTGASFMLTTGNAEVEITSGEVIDVAAGEAVASGSALRRNARYFCAEDTVAAFKSVDGTAFMVEGRFSPDAGTSRQYQDYSDVLGLEWYTDFARYVKSSGLYHDYDSDTFRPMETITRAELVYALWNACGRPESTYAPAFTDLQEDWYILAVCWAAERGVTAGTTDTTFSPMGGVNREQLATILYKCAQILGSDITPRTDLSVYSDWENISDWSAEQISWATAKGYIAGMADGTVKPWGSATRAQAATIIMRYAEDNIPEDAPEAPAPVDSADDPAPSAGEDGTVG